MRFAGGLVLLASLVLAAAGCAFSGTRVHGDVDPVNPTIQPIRAARESNRRLFSVFPGYAGAHRCAIPEGGMSRHRLRGTCTTSVAHPVTHGRWAEAFVDFREDWGRRHATWTLIVQLPAEKVVATQVHGAPAPQYRYQNSFRPPAG